MTISARHHNEEEMKLRIERERKRKSDRKNGGKIMIGDNNKRKKKVWKIKN